MPLYVIEREFLVPVYEHVLVEAADLTSACREALDEHRCPWGDDAEMAYDDARPVVIAQAVELTEALSAELQEGDEIDRSTLSDLLYHSGLDLLPIPTEVTEEAADAVESIGFS
jgi:hypothetical protein